MKLLLKFTILVEKGNEAMANGSLQSSIKNLIENLNIEAAYFYLEDGKRAGMIVFEASDDFQAAEVNEPFFAAVNASIDIQPTYNAEELFGSL